ncbi:hypothetical protein [Stenotrophomonas maltophilia]|uniref:hypothetical protein n=1 Tax=Stenotrophomonas maltophilia TaxID=40324 RepID=UPI0028942650|nr:hypothetical protein [Stenotrophomonas maltophilia]MDT3487625.1 hypothetical protein [Stenotrophomonas maltophilia]
MVAVQSQEATGNNRIPAMAADLLAARLGLKVAPDIVQAAKVNRSGGDALLRDDVAKIVEWRNAIRGNRLARDALKPPFPRMGDE